MAATGDELEHLRAEVAALHAETSTLRDELEHSRRALANTQQLAHVGNWEWDLRANRVTWSDEMYRLAGYEPGEVELELATVHTGQVFIHPEDRERRMRFLEALRQHPGEEFGLTERLLQRDGGFKPIIGRARVELDEHGEPARYCGTIQDVSAEMRSREAERLLSEIVTSTSDAIYTLDIDMRIRSWNPGAERLYGYSAAEVIGQPAAALLVPEDFTLELGAAYRARMFSGDYARDEIELVRRCKDGTLVEVAETIAPLLDFEDNVIGLVGSARDISERRRTEARLTQLANHDVLTGLFNRRRFEEELTAAIARAKQEGHRGAVLLLDLDNFKYINEAHGHKSGDELVASIPNALLPLLRDTDSLARVGGDEYAVLVAPATAAQARTLAEQLLAAVREHGFQLEGTPLSVSVSIGVANFTGVADTEGVLADADRAMYQSKEAGRDRITVFECAQRTAVREQLSHTTEHLIRNALQHDRFELYAQPIVNLSSGLMTHCEVLLRLNDDGTIVGPGDFLPAAERLGLIHLIDRWVIDRAFALASKHPDLTFDINLSGATIDDDHLARYIAERLEHHGTDPHRIVFELTETAAVGSITKAGELATRLAEFGCTFAIDDFGTGFSTFYYLKHFPAHYVKIDGEFLSDTRTRMDDLVIESIVRIGRDLGKQTIAEYVSDAARLERVRGLGVDFGQGYHFAKPFPTAELDGYPRRLIGAQS